MLKNIARAMFTFRPHIIGILLPFTFVGGLTNNYFEIAPFSLIISVLLIKNRYILTLIATLIFLFTIVTLKVDHDSVNESFLFRIFFYVFNFSVFIIYSRLLKRSEVVKIFQISSGIMFASIILARLSTEIQSFFYIWSRSYGDALAVLEYSGGVSGLASEPSYAAGFLGTVLIGALSLWKVTEPSVDKKIIASIFFCVGGILLCGSLTGYLSLVIIFLVHVSNSMRIFFLLALGVLIHFLEQGAFLHSFITPLQRANYIFLNVLENFSVILFESSITARNSVFLEFFYHPYAGGLLLGADRTVTTSGNFMIETIHILFAPLDYILIAAMFIFLFDERYRQCVILVLLQLIIIQPSLVVYGLLAFKNVIISDKKSH